MSHVCGPDCLAICKHAQAGVGGVGRPKAHPAVKGRDKREQEYAAAHPGCECAGCDGCFKYGYTSGCWRAATEIDHIGGRGLGGHKRQTARLRALCHECHMADPHGRKALPASGLGAIR